MRLSILAVLTGLMFMVVIADSFAGVGDAQIKKVNWMQRAELIESDLKKALVVYKKEGSRAGSEAVIDVYFNIYEEPTANFEEFIEHGLSHEDAEVVGEGFKEIRQSMRKDVSHKEIKKMINKLSIMLKSLAKDLEKI